ncbi:aldehyde dehydrogenase (NADP(+)) [Novosphingobium flavum]|uniref:aldehyde dehydrogenase family protein n=1 Tax=Novosphingobium aerophilum TaxID=2839843 RepID=UPI00163A4C83|nr:aldehyde dehydrogenase (NADP(+)) [Novosphingobium aerophilum]
MPDGSIIIAGETRQTVERFRATDAATGKPIDQTYSQAGAEDVRDACALAERAAPAFAALDPEARAGFLEAMAEEILALGDELVAMAMVESGLPRARLEGERGRTVGQLRLFAGELRRGEWLDLTIDPALPDRAPPRADLRRMNQPLGPVAVFGASNFPLAFSVAGGDTASALAAGCPVIVKGHPAHPGTGELVARAITAAVAACGLPAGVFSYLPGPAPALGAALVADLRIKAVGFTGSRAGGLALARIAAERPEPIPIYAEMSAVNPVVILPQALAARAERLGAEFVGSLTLGAGQFCTNPGLVLLIEGEGCTRFKTAAAQALAATQPHAMLTPAIHGAFSAGVAALDASPDVTRIASGPTPATPNQGCGALFETSAARFLANPALGEEVFGASSLLVICADLGELAQVIAGLEGQLTATIHHDGADAAAAAQLLPGLARKAGRVLANGWPTGVEVCHAMVHGGPFPATTDPRTSSVGTLAMARFLRPVCYQDIAVGLLPAALQDDNPWSLPRTVNGVRERPA